MRALPLLVAASVLGLCGCGEAPTPKPRRTTPTTANTTGGAAPRADPPARPNIKFDVLPPTKPARPTEPTEPKKAPQEIHKAK